MILRNNHAVRTAAADPAWKNEADQVVSDLTRGFQAAPRQKGWPNLSFGAAEIVYSKLRKAIRDVFAGKCAYCEKNLGSDSGDVEHYRPRARPTGAKDHPGYFWLVVDPDNLMIACRRCNGKKRTNFPVKVRSDDATKTSAELDALEQPLLLNPYRHDTSPHLKFAANSGKIISTSPEGAVTITLLKLDDDTLEDERKAAQDDAWLKLFALFLDKPAEFRQSLAQIFAGNHPFAAAVIVHVLERLRERGLSHDVTVPFAYTPDQAATPASN
jgi:uncharacterized protein (TIGR02646 family)